MNGLYAGQVTHARITPRRHSLAYRIFMVRLDLNDLAQEGRIRQLFSINRFNLFSVHERDHGDGSATPLREQVAAKLEQAGLKGAGAHIEMLVMPRILGRAFNPLTVYFCRDARGRLAAILYEVNNTFGERHNYMIAAGAVRRDGAVRQNAPKRFHVSPFMDMDLDYQFDVTPPADSVAIRILVSEQGAPVLTAAFTGQGVPMTDAALIRAWLTHPWQTFGVLAAIHWEAIRIVLKGIGYRPKPPAPAAAVTVGRAG
jgi:uncharacterized protein